MRSSLGDGAFVSSRVGRRARECAEVSLPSAPADLPRGRRRSGRHANRRRARRYQERARRGSSSRGFIDELLGDAWALPALDPDFLFGHLGDPYEELLELRFHPFLRRTSV